MDNRRWDTGQVLAGGILNIAPPKTDIPKDREQVEAQGESWNYIGADAFIAAVEAGKVVNSPNYYGIPYGWRESEGVYRGTLLQYCAVTENPTFGTAIELEEWFAEMYRATDG